MGWGLLNLIVAAIVDANIAAREDDIRSAAKISKKSREEASAAFSTLFKDMDTDGSGEISVDEFKECLKTNELLQLQLTIMGITEHDMLGLLEIMDGWKWFP